VHARHGILSSRSSVLRIGTGGVLQLWFFMCRLHVDLTVVHILVGSVADVVKFICLEVVQLAGAFLVYPVFQVSLTAAGVMFQLYRHV